MVVVPDYQLSLAIGKEGQNVRLAAKLTNWKIDIKSVTQFEEYLEEENITEEDLYARLGYEEDDEAEVETESKEENSEIELDDYTEETEEDLENIDLEQ